MKEVGFQKFGLLYDKLYEYLEKTGGNIEGAGIKDAALRERLTKLWEEGKSWETISFVIIHHYTRTDSLLLKLSETSSMFSKNSSIEEIESTLGISIPKVQTSGAKRPVETIENWKYEIEYSKVRELLRDKKGKTIIPILKNFGMIDYSLLNNFWKRGNEWEVITTIVVLRLGHIYFGRVEVETERGKFSFKRFKRNSSAYEIIETLMKGA